MPRVATSRKRHERTIESRDARLAVHVIAPLHHVVRGPRERHGRGMRWSGICERGTT